MKRVALGLLLVLHGLAHAGAGMWIADRTPPWLLTVVWTTAMVGFVAAGFGVLGVPLLRAHWRRLLVAAAVSSMILLVLGRNPLLSLGILIDATLLALALRGSPAAPAGDASPRRRRHPALARGAHVVAGLFVAYLAALTLLRPWHTRWGTTEAERRAPLVGDELVPQAHYRMDHAVTIQAPPDSVWPWLVQIGQDRGGFYSYDWLERAIGADIHNVDRIVPEWQQRQVGDLVRSTPPDYMGGILGRDVGWRVAALEPGRALVLENWGAFVLRPVGDSATRLHIRLRGEGRPTVAGVFLAPLGLLVFEPAHFIMERGMMLGIKRRAERRGHWGRVAPGMPEALLGAPPAR